MRIRGLLVVLILLALAAPAHAAGGASPGAAGIGDRLFPGLGNGGYVAVPTEPGDDTASTARSRSGAHSPRARGVEPP